VETGRTAHRGRKKIDRLRHLETRNLLGRLYNLRFSVTFSSIDLARAIVYLTPLDTLYIPALLRVVVGQEADPDTMAECAKELFNSPERDTQPAILDAVIELQDRAHGARRPHTPRAVRVRRGVPDQAGRTDRRSRTPGLGRRTGNAVSHPEAMHRATFPGNLASTAVPGEWRGPALSTPALPIVRQAPECR
jgi:hypothetical protein